MNIQKVSAVAPVHGIKALVYGVPGAGKTTLATTTPDPEGTLILSAESGLLSIAQSGADIDVAVINTIDDLIEAYQFLAQEKRYSWVILDSISEIAEKILETEKASTKDGRMAYGNLAERMVKLCKSFRDLPGVNVIFIAKQKTVRSDFVPEFNTPSFPGSRLDNEIPYMFDLVACLRVKKDEDSNIKRALMCQPTEEYIAKDRSGKLDQFEPAHWGRIVEKINS